MLGGPLVGVTAVRLLDETVPGGGFHPVGPGSLADVAKLFLEIVAVQPGPALGQEIVLENHLHLGSVLVGLVAARLDVLLDVFPVAAEGLAEVDHHVDLVGSVPAGQFGLVSLGLGAGVAMGKPDDAPYVDPATIQQFLGPLDGVGLDAYGGGLVLGGEAATVFQVLVRHRRVQERVIDHLGEFVVAVFHLGTLPKAVVSRVDK